MKLSVVEIGHLPLYNQDVDDHPPAEWTAFRERIKAADAVLFVTPEHNRSVISRRLLIYRKTFSAQLALIPERCDAS